MNPTSRDSNNPANVQVQAYRHSRCSCRRVNINPYMKVALESLISERLSQTPCQCQSSPSNVNLPLRTSLQEHRSLERFKYEDQLRQRTSLLTIDKPLKEIDTFAAYPQASTAQDGFNRISGNQSDPGLKASKCTTPKKKGHYSLRTIRARNDFQDISMLVDESSESTTSSSSKWKIGKLTYCNKKTLNTVLDQLLHTKFGLDCLYMSNKVDFSSCSNAQIANPNNFYIVAEKLHRNFYMYLSEFIHDIRHIMLLWNPPYASKKSLKRYFKNLTRFRNTFDALLEQEFPNHVTGNSSGLFGLFTVKEVDETEADENGDQ